MLNRGILIVALAAGLFAGSVLAGFLLATGALRHVPRSASFAGIPGSPAALPGHNAGGTTTVAPGAGSAPASGASGTAPVTEVTPPTPNAPSAGTTAIAPPGPGPARPAPAPPGPAPSAAANPPSASSTPPASGGAAPPSAAEPTAVPGRFHVQVGDFQERLSADALATHLRTRGYAVTVTDEPPYRVWVGGYLDRATAERLAAYLRQSGLSPTLVPQ